MNKRLYVGNISYQATDEDLKNHFNQVGPVVSAKVIRYQDSGRSKSNGDFQRQGAYGKKDCCF
jgi:RNA recognition motif-containing protein